MSSAIQKKTVGAMGNHRDNRYRPLFDALAQLYPVEFREIVSLNDEILDGVIVLDGRVSEGLAAATRGIPAYVVVTDGPGASRVTGSELRFGTSGRLEACLRGQVMTETQAGALPALSVEAGDEVLASKDGHPVWFSRPAGNSRCQMVAVPPPVLTQKELLFQHLSGGRFLGLLPLVNFLRQIVQECDWQGAPVRACLVFDDPSLYWPSYGFLDYRLLAEHAIKHDYYVSVATIPLDTWWVNRAVAATFRSFSPRLSVIIHGNNHTAREMLVENSPASQLQMAAQALRRIERLELRHGFTGLRIMEAPHGAIAYGMMRHLMSLGYEAVLCTRELLMRHNPATIWPVVLGMDRAEFLGGGLPVISRIKMSAMWKNEVILATFLQQPFVIAGHHWDAAERFRILEEVARMVNDLHCVTWSSPLDIARCNYKYVQYDDELNLKLYSRTLRIPVPEGVRNLFIHRPWLQSGTETEMLQVRDSGREVFRGSGTAVVGPIPIDAPGVLDICCPPMHQVDFRTVRAPRLESWPVVRKFVMEVRDRSSPVRYKTMRLIRGTKARLPGKKEDY